MTKSAQSHALELYTELLDIPESKQEEFLARQDIKQETLDYLYRMMEVSEQTRSLFNSPINQKIGVSNEWNPSEIIGSTIGGIAVNEVIHHGPIATVYKGWQEEPTPRNVALKLVHSTLNEDFFVQFKLEQNAMATLVHPNIATIHFVGETQHGQPYLVMEYINGKVFAQHCDEQRLDVKQRLTLFLQVCGAISYSHNRGILHRDIKSSNIVVREYEDQDIPIIIDFGLSNHGHKSATQNSTQNMGTPEYMSPECINNAADIDVRADVYALGMVLFHLLVGKIPFDRKRYFNLNNEDRQTMIAEFEIPSLGEYFESLTSENQSQIASSRESTTFSYKKALSAELNAIYKKATQKNPELRYPTAQAFARDVERYINNHAVIAFEAAPPFYKLKKLVQRHYLASVISAVGLAGILTASVALINQYQQTQLEYTRAEQEKEIAQQVSRFTSDIFRSIEISGTGEDQPQKVKDILERQVLRIKNEETLSKEVRFKTMLLLASLYLSQSETQLAQDIATHILAQSDANNLDINLSANLVAYRATQHQKGLAKAAEHHIREVLELVERDSIDPYLRSQAFLTAAWYDINVKKDFESGIEKMKRNVERLTKILGEDSLEVGRVLSHLGAALAQNGKLKDSLDVYEKVLANYRRHRSQDHPDILRYEFWASHLLERQGQRGPSLARYEAAFNKMKATHSRTHHDLLWRSREIAKMYASSQRFDLAFEVIEEISPILAAEYGDRSAIYIDTQGLFAEILFKSGQREESIGSFKKWIKLSDAQFGQMSQTSSDLKWRLFKVYSSNNDLDEAYQLVDQLYKNAVKKFDPGNQLVHFALTQRSIIDIKQGKFSKARRALRQALSYIKQSNNSDDMTYLFHLAMAAANFAEARESKGTAIPLTALSQGFAYFEQQQHVYPDEFSLVSAWHSELVDSRTNQ